jgi:hypothetical protein
MNADEYRAMIELAKNAGPEECEMCGSVNTKPRNSTVVKVLKIVLLNMWGDFGNYFTAIRYNLVLRHPRFRDQLIRISTTMG